MTKVHITNRQNVWFLRFRHVVSFTVRWCNRLSGTASRSAAQNSRRGNCVCVQQMVHRSRTRAAPHMSSVDVRDLLRSV